MTLLWPKKYIFHMDSSFPYTTVSFTHETAMMPLAAPLEIHAAGLSQPLKRAPLLRYGLRWPPLPEGNQRPPKAVANRPPQCGSAG